MSIIRNSLRGSDRLVATAIIWIILVMVLNRLQSIFLDGYMNINFQGLWVSFYGSTNINPFTMSQLEEVGWRLRDPMMTQINQLVQTQMGANIAIMVILALALILAATVSTFAIWRKAHMETDAAPQARRGSQAKVKRGGRVELVMDSLSEDELMELRARLIEAENAEAVPLEDLLFNPEAERRGRR